MPTIESICNQALDLVGYKRHIGNIYEGSVASRIALDVWGQTRDALLERLAPDWAQREFTLTLLRSAPNILNGTARYDSGWTPNFPPLPYLYEYAYPDDCITPQQIKYTPITLPIWRPKFIPMRINNTTTMSILTNQEDAILIGIAKVLDPEDWHDAFITAMKATLAKQFEPALAPEMHARNEQQRQQPNADSAG